MPVYLKESGFYYRKYIHEEVFRIAAGVYFIMTEAVEMAGSRR